MSSLNAKRCMSFSRLHAKRCTLKRPAALQVENSTINGVPNTHNDMGVKSKIQKENLETVPKLPHNIIQNLRRQLHAVQHVSIWPFETLRARSTGSSACSRRHTSSPSPSLGARFGKGAWFGEEMEQRGEMELIGWKNSIQVH